MTSELRTTKYILCSPKPITMVTFQQYQSQRFTKQNKNSCFI